MRGKQVNARVRLAPAAKSRGFSLLELVIVLIIVAILVAIAIPLYGHVQELARRTQAVSALQTMAAREEAYYARCNTYAAAPASLGYPQVITTSGGYYKISIAAADANGYTLHAVPQAIGNQNRDVCGTFILDSLGKESVSGSGNAVECWHSGH